jgi:hypothetical protein
MHFRKSRYNNGLIAKLVSIFADVEERGEEREESLALMQATSWTRNHKAYVGLNKSIREEE